MAKKKPAPSRPVDPEVERINRVGDQIRDTLDLARTSVAHLVEVLTREGVFPEVIAYALDGGARRILDEREQAKRKARRVR